MKWRVIPNCIPKNLEICLNDWNCPELVHRRSWPKFDYHKILHFLVFRFFSWKDILCRLYFSFLSWAVDEDGIKLPNSGGSNIELSMRKDWIGQVHTNFLKCLSLGLIDGHRETGFDWKLESLELKGEIHGNQGNPQDEHLGFVLCKCHSEWRPQELLVSGL